MEFTGKKELVKKVQKFYKLPEDGIDGPNTWSAIYNGLNIVETPVNPQITDAVTQLSPKSIDLILEYEVGGGKSYYTKFLQKPTWPKGASGVTIGIGYDLGYNDFNQFAQDWKGKINEEDFSRLSKVLGKKGDSAANVVSTVRDIIIPWDAAFEVFQNNTIPRFIKQTLQAFPQADQLHPDAFGALVSLVFNRGASVTGDSRKEMLNIRNLTPQKDYRSIAQEIRNMKRLWAGKGLNGLLIRRDKEAELVESCI